MGIGGARPFLGPSRAQKSKIANIAQIQDLQLHRVYNTEITVQEVCCLF